VGLGGTPTEWDDYLWLDLADEPEPGLIPEAEALAWLTDNHVWQDGNRERVLVVDLDNLRADAGRLRDRMTLVVALARTADRAIFAGQVGAVARSRPWLDSFADSVIEVDDGPDAADHALIDAALAGRSRRAMQFVVASNDGIFAALAKHGPVTLLSPSLSAASKRLETAATRLFDLRKFHSGLVAA
jgi:hypothetical protein